MSEEKQPVDESKKALVSAENEVGAPVSPEASEISEEELDDGSMTLIAHLTELRSRIIKCLAAVVIGSCIAYFLSTISCII